MIYHIKFQTDSKRCQDVCRPFQCLMWRFFLLKAALRLLPVKQNGSSILSEGYSEELVGHSRTRMIEAHLLVTHISQVNCLNWYVYKNWPFQLGHSITERGTLLINSGTVMDRYRSLTNATWKSNVTFLCEMGRFSVTFGSSSLLSFDNQKSKSFLITPNSTQCIQSMTHELTKSRDFTLANGQTPSLHEPKSQTGAFSVQVKKYGPVRIYWFFCQ